MSTRNVSKVKCGVCVGLTTFPPSVRSVRSLTSHNLIGLQGLLRGELGFFLFLLFKHVPARTQCAGVVHNLHNCYAITILCFSELKCHQASVPSGDKNRLAVTFLLNTGSKFWKYCVHCTYSTWYLYKCFEVVTAQQWHWWDMLLVG
jgi:hypothetical protein